MKIFISQPMQGKTNEEIKTERERLIAKARERYGEDIEVIDSFFETPRRMQGRCGSWASRWSC